MDHTILLYGATGYSGQIIAREAARAVREDEGFAAVQFVLAGRNGRSVARLAAELQLDHRVFALDEREPIVRALDDVDVVINAAGPFALTAEPLAKGALAAMSHYVDINGEAEVYMKVDDLGRHAIQRERVMVAGAGHTAAASDLLLHAALNELRAMVSDQEDTAPTLGAVRIALSRITTLSQGSLETLWRSMREQVRTIRLRETPGSSPGKPGTATHVIWHEPVGKLEREFDFFDPAAERQKTRQRSQARRIASAANLLDTLTARLTVERLGFLAKRIESYVEAGTIARLAYQIGPVFAPLAALPLARDVVRLQLQAFPVGPTSEERKREPHLTVLEIDDVFHEPVLHWALHTPNPYDFTARIVLEIARRTTVTKLCGWLTPSELLRPTKDDLRGRAKYLRGCELHERRTPVLEPV